MDVSQGGVHHQEGHILFKEKQSVIFSLPPSDLFCFSDSTPAMDVSQGGAELAAFLFETLPAYQDRASQLCVERVIAKALKAHPSFAKPFASALLQRGLKQPASSSSSSSPPVPQFMAPFMRHKLLRWSCILLRCCPDIASAKTAFARLAQLQGIQITEILKDPHPRGAEASRHCIAALLRTVSWHSSRL